MPGVDSLLVLKNTMFHGKKAGYFTMMGIIIALFIWTAFAVFGLATIVSKSMFLFNLIKYGGAAYLVWLGIQSWRSKAQNMELQDKEIKTDMHSESKNQSLNCLTQGITTDLLNPKTLLLYVTLMPQFINPNEDVNMQLFLLAFILVILSIVWLSIVVMIINVIRKWFMKTTVQSAFNKTTGIVLVLIGVKIASEKA